MNKVKQSNLSVSLIIYDLECDPNSVTKLLGIEPTNVERLGDLTRAGRPKLHSSNCWQLSSGLSDKSNLEEHVQELFSILGDLSKVSQVSTSWGVKIDCCVEFYGDDTSINLSLSEDAIHKMSIWKSYMDVDYYLLQ